MSSTSESWDGKGGTDGVPGDGRIRCLDLGGEDMDAKSSDEEFKFELTDDVSEPVLEESEKDGEGERESGVCTKCGMVAMRGDSAQGRLFDVRSCSRVGSINFMNFSAAPAPQGNFSGLSNVFPKRMSSAECFCRNRPWT